MPIPELELHRVEKLLVDYCERRVPPHAKHQVNLTFARRGHSFTLYEERPYFLDETRTTRRSVARFDFDPKLATWHLKCRARERWYPYGPLEAARRFEDLLDEVDADPTGIFWG